MTGRSWRFVYEVDGVEQGASGPGSWGTCWRLAQLFARLDGPGIVSLRSCPATVEHLERGWITLPELLEGWLPGSVSQPWTWDDEEHDILTRCCLCCGRTGHYQERLEAHLAEHGLTQGVCLGDDGSVWDGHHRIVAARRLGIVRIPLESPADAEARWRRDHGDVAWQYRTFGDAALDDEVAS